LPLAKLNSSPKETQIILGIEIMGLARKFLYIIAVIIVLIIASGFILRLYQNELTELATVPDSDFLALEKTSPDIYDQDDMWFSRGDKAQIAQNPTLWKPDDFKDEARKGDAAIFFIHPTSYLEKTNWNAPLDDSQSQLRAKLFLRGMASTFNNAGDIWAPRYRQATFGAFLTSANEGQLAQKAAYDDVLRAFDRFINDIDDDRPIILAGHSQGSLHLLGLLKDRIAGQKLTQRIVTAYVVGWPISVGNDLPSLGLEPCQESKMINCIMSWQSFAEPADYEQLEYYYERSIGLDGKPRANSSIVCTNPISGNYYGKTEAAQNLGTLVPNTELTEGRLVKKSVPARCNHDGFLLIGDPPDLGPYVLPGNNYHVYDYPLFWMNIRQDAMERLNAFTQSIKN